MVKVSVIVPVFGVENYIERCARSIFEQTYQDLDIIFVNDCTPDDSIRILKETLQRYPTMKDKTRIISHDINRGVAAARKIGMLNSIGEYVIQFDADDYINSNMIESLLNKALQDNSDIVICDFNTIYDGSIKRVSVGPSLNPRECASQILRGEVHGSLCNKLIKRSLLYQHHIFPIEGCDMCEDLIVTYRACYFASKISYVPQPFYNYILYRKGGLTASQMNQKVQRSLQTVAKSMNDFVILNKIDIHSNNIKNAIRDWQVKTLGNILLHGNLEAIDKFSFKSLCVSDFLACKHCSYKIRIVGICYNLHLSYIIKTMRNLYLRISHT